MSGVDPYAERVPRAAAAPAGPPGWLESVERRGGVVVASASAVVERATELAAAPLVVVAPRGDGVLAPLARLDPARAVLLALVTEGSPASRSTPRDALGVLVSCEAELLAVKHGWVGGPPGSAGCVEVDTALVEPVLAAVDAGRGGWERDPDFGYEVALPPPELEEEPALALRPRLLYARHRRVYEHAAQVAELKRGWAAFLAQGCETPDAVVDAAGWPPPP